MNGWKPDGGITRSGESRAEDQAGDFFVTRFRHPDLPNAVITCKSYAYTGIPAVPGVFLAATDVEWLICGDPARPAQTATWHTIEREEEDGSWPTAAKAEEAAGEAAEAWLLAAGTIDWDGRPR